MEIIQNERGFVAATMDVEVEDKSNAVRCHACQLLAIWQPHGSGGNHVMPYVDGKLVWQEVFLDDPLNSEPLKV
jgi:hypothetical protein